MKLIKKGIGFTVGVTVGALSLFTYQQFDDELPLTAFPTLERQGYTVAYDTRGKIPFWTHEQLSEESLKVEANRGGIGFREDPDLYRPHRSSTADYSKSGFDRGHIVPAASQRHTKEALRETFYLSNICPQHPQFNRGVWKKLEEHLRTLVKTEGELEIVSGPLFLSHEKKGKRFITYEVIGKNEVAVPTHFFKVVKTKEKSWAYVLPNEAISGELKEYLFPIDKLEKISGIRFNSIE